MGPNGSGTSTGRIASFTLQTGGTIAYSYPAPCAFIPGWSGYGSGTLTRTTQDGTTTYTASTSGAITTTTVLDPGKNKKVYYISGLFLLGIDVYQNTGTVSSPVYALLASDTICYSGNQTNCRSASPVYPISQRDTYHTIGGMSSSSRVSETFDTTYGNRTSVARYNFGASSFDTKTTTTYGSWNGSSCVAVGNNIVDKPCRVTTTDSASHTIADATYSYLSNGFLSGENHWTGSTWITTMTASANGNGTVHQRFNVQGNPTTYSYAATGSGGCNGLLPTGTSTIVGTVTLTTGATWDCNGGKLLSSTDENGNTSHFTYDALFRLTSQTDPLGFQVSESYTSNSETASWSIPTGASSSTTTTVDGLGRSTLIQTTDGASYDTVSKGEGFNGTQFQINTSQPCISPLNTGCTINHFSYVDPLGREIYAATTSNETVNIYYNQNDVQTVLSPAPSGEHTKTAQVEYDGIGRVKSACAVQTSGGPACGQVDGNSGIVTNYSYSYGAGSSTTTATRGIQIRTTVKDALGRVISQTDPESGTKQYIYDYYAPTACGNPANLPGRLYVVAQASNNDKCFDYDSIGRMTDMGENLANNSAFVCTRFRFDTSSNGIFTAPGTISNGKGRMVEAETDDCTVYPPTAGHWFSDEWFSYDAMGNVTDVWEKTPHSGGYYHSTATYFANGKMSSLGIPAVGTINYTLDAKGRWYSAKIGTLNLVSGVTYGPLGATQINIGSGTDKDAYTYSSTTGLMTSYQLTGGSKTVTGTLNWNANRTLGSLQIVDGWNTADNETCTFIYDDLSRLTSDQCGSIWAQTYSYDMYDNLNQFGNDPFTFTYYAANNHYSTVGVTYDADGDLTYDGVNNYTYNASDRLWSAIPSGSGNTCANDGWASCITYDAFGHSIEIYQGGVYYQRVYGPAGKTVGMQGQTLNYAYAPLPGGSRALYWAGAYDYTHVDWLGSGRLATSIPASGNGALYYDRQFSPFGEMYGNSGPTIYSQSFTGDTPDTFVGLLDTPNRELNQSQGRWLTPDPARSGWNLYGYSTNPNSEIDPTGLYGYEVSSCGGDENPCTSEDNNVSNSDLPDAPSSVLRPFWQWLNVNLVYTTVAGSIPGAADQLWGGALWDMAVGTRYGHNGSAGAWEGRPLAAAVFGSNNVLGNAANTMNLVTGVYAAGFALGGAVALAPGIIAGGSNYLAFGSSVGRVFYSGYGAATAALTAAGAYGGQVINTTPAGRVLEFAENVMTVSGTDVDEINAMTRPLWNAASVPFAAGANGTVLTFQSWGLGLNATWAAEYSTLVGNGTPIVWMQAGW